MTVSDTFPALSNFIDVQRLEYGGRTCVARQKLTRGTVLLRLTEPLGSSIVYDLRKEVFHCCYNYEYGKSMKIRISPEQLKKTGSSSKRKEFLGGGLWFCSQICCGKFLSKDNILELIEGYENIIQYLRQSLKRRTAQKGIPEEVISTEVTKELIEEQWTTLEEMWLNELSGMKETRRMNLLKPMTEEHYECARFVTECLFRLEWDRKDSTLYTSFFSLQSNELEKIQAFPVLLGFQIDVFKMLAVLLPPSLRSMLNPRLFRQILGSEYGNSFGIWQKGEGSDSREYFGYWVLSQGSYFNHSCSPNLIKRRVDNTMEFVLGRDVFSGEQLFIDYKGLLDLPVTERREILKSNWFFDCMCDRCMSELQAVH